MQSSDRCVRASSERMTSAVVNQQRAFAYVLGVHNDEPSRTFFVALVKPDIN